MTDYDAGASSSRAHGRSKLGSKRQMPNGRWEVSVSSGYRTDGTQRRVYRTADTEREADAMIASLAAEMGRLPHLGDNVTLGWYWEAVYVPTRFPSLVRGTRDAYEGVWRREIAPEFGSVALVDVTAAKVRRWVAPMTHSRAEHAVRVLRTVLRAAWEDGLLDEEPLRQRIRLPQDGAYEQGEVWGAAEVSRALVLMRGLPLERLWLVMVGGGLRREEAVALFASDLTFSKLPDGGTVCHVRVDDAVTEADGRKRVKTARSRRVVEVADPFAARLSETQPEDGTTPICPISVHGIYKAWRRLWDEPKNQGDSYYRGALRELPYVPLSRMRATHETLAQAAGVSDTLNAAMHGRTNVQTGYRHYLVPGTPAMVEAARAVGGQVSDDV